MIKFDIEEPIGFFSFLWPVFRSATRGSFIKNTFLTIPCMENIRVNPRAETRGFCESRRGSF